jgi:DNA-binding MarR family transcriptional regulator
LTAGGGKATPDAVRKLLLDAYLPYRLSVASNAVSSVIARAYQARFGLKVAEWRLITILAEAEDRTQLELVARTAMDKVTVSRAAQALVARGLAAQRADARDGRSRRLSLTLEGRRLYADVAPAAVKFEHDMLAGFDADEIEVFKALLRRIEAAARAQEPD